ncbi:MAG: cyclic beta 1-2 glucan synthetase, partial [Oxalobacter sp.]|nr:cyclic beta 1-2 glucan synthetase [Oxalobacter sp.]
MGQYGKFLAGKHILDRKKTPDRLLPRLAENETVLHRVFNLLSSAVKSENRITPAAEWLLDNYYLIDEQIQTAKRHLPSQYSKELPKLASGPSEGRPRVYDLALEIVSHGDGRIDAGKITAFISAYQSVALLTMGELWAIPIMLRLALIENLRRVAVRVAISRKHHELAEEWVQKFLDTAENNPADLILQVADLARSHPPMVSAFVAEMTRRLQSQKAILTLPLAWISERLSETGMTIEQLVVLETQRQAADQVSISNSIASIRLLGSMDWHDFFESVSLVEQTLKTDPAGIYSEMDFHSRDYYRHLIEKIAKHSPFTENEVAEKAIEMAHRNASQDEAEPRSSHVGYYLAAEGLPLLEEITGMRKTLGESIMGWFTGSRVFAYIGSIIVLSVLFTAGMLSLTAAPAFPMWFRILLGITTLIASSQLAVSLVNWIAMLAAPSVPLPRMDFSKGIPDGCETLIAIPCMLINKENIDKLCETLEIHYLGNRDEKLHFCLLSDFLDADTGSAATDDELVQYVKEKIEELNRQYKNDDSTPFWLLHRPRRFNDRENVWMGYERKRGKLEELNAFLRRRSSGFSVRIGDFRHVERIRFVITLDSDTHLFRDTARQFIATLAHPLNRAVYDEKDHVVTRGYGILQPRVASSLPGRHASIYERLNSGDAGIDPYTRTVSDVYQDLFGEGSFIGKGIYDVDAVSYALNGRLPQNRVLSHDLLEGCYARSGLVSDVPLYEKYPADYISDVKRRHRWIRGDWQLINWLLPFVPDALSSAKGKRRANPLSALSHWKLFDNLRRSLVPPAMIFLFAAAWSVLKPAWAWTLGLLAVFFLHPLLLFMMELIVKRRGIDIKQHLSACMTATNRHCSNVFLNFMALPHEASYHTDAILRTLWRTTVSHRHLLEWIPSGQVKSDSENPMAYLRMMWFAPFFSLATAIAVFLVKPVSLIIAAPFLLLWLCSPLISWRISQPVRHEEKALSSEQTLYLRKLARRIWAFFDAYVGPEDNWLPPDNVQEMPQYGMAGEISIPEEVPGDAAEIVVAHRTSPTNIGMALLAYLAACDFGYIPVGQLIGRTQKTFASMQKLDRYCGHFYNWYDTQTLKTIQNPLYISTVDSGNLAGHLLTLKSGLLGLIHQRVITPCLANGIFDTFSLFSETAGKNSARMEKIRMLLEKPAEGVHQTLHEICHHLEQFTHAVEQIIPETTHNIDSPAAFWGNALLSQCRQIQDEIVTLMPWVTIPYWQNNPDRFEKLNHISTLDELAHYPETLIPEIISAQKQAQHEEKAFLNILSERVSAAGKNAAARISQLRVLAQQADEFAQMDFRFLLNPTTKLLTIGFNVTDKKRDNSYYDLLASEARLSSFVTIAQGQIPQDNWFALGRKLTVVGKDAILLSWSGSMFEYLMPQLVMPVYEDTLLDQTHRMAVKKQIEYGTDRRVPWGISESGYFAFDARLNYQYRAFGVPGLGLKRGLGDDLVIAPYATMLALMVDPQAACENLIRLEKDGYSGKFGLFEAIDFTPSRLTRGQEPAVIRSFMAHHQGMGFLSLLYLLMDKPMQKRFEAEPGFQATIPLLHERVPKNVPYFELAPGHATTHLASIAGEMPSRIYSTANTPLPEVQLLSNGHYHVMLTNAGGGYSRFKDIAVSRWYEDAVQDNWGTWFYLRDREAGEFWSTTYQPV